MDEDAGSMKRISKSGSGGVVTKSIGINPRKGYPNPTVIEIECGILNAMGLPNPGIDEFKYEIIELKKSDIKIIGSIFGSNSEEFIKLAEKMEEYGSDAVELNMSCPHAKGYGLEIGSDPDIVYEIVKKVKQKINIPVFVKISPNLHNIIEIAQIIEKAKADAIVAINTVKAMKIDIDIRKPVLANKIGGYSGKAIKPIGVRCVYEIYENTKIPIIGVGGITSGEDAIEYILAGASAIEIGSAIYYRGIDVFNKICKEIKNWMKENKIERISDFIGEAHR